MVIFLPSGGREGYPNLWPDMAEQWKEPEDIERENAVLVLSSDLE
jgi:hypothetical protein